MEVKEHAGEVGSKTYKRHIRIFKEDSVQEWIELIQNMKLIWHQNGTDQARYRAAQLRTMLKGESLSIFEESITDEQAQGTIPLY